nr:aldo/keto reductase [Tissierella sp.]
MLYRKFGKTNEMVSILGFGCMRFPTTIEGDMSSIDEEKSLEMVRYAIDNGVNYLDTAYPYHGSGMGGGGASEPFVAKVIKDGYREKVKIATKLPSWLIETREDMDKYLDEQLERLDIETIDFYLLHSLNKESWENLKKLGVDEFLDSAIADGRIKHVGFSYHDKPEYFNEIVDYYNFSFCQIQYNYLDEEYQAGLAGLNYARKKDLGIVVMEPLRGGKLVDKLPGEIIELFNKAKIRRTPAEWALRWVWNNADVSILLSGMSTMEQVIENVNIAKDAQESSLKEEELDLIDRVKEIFKNKIKVNCTDCKYCMPCPQGVDIPRNFSIYNNYSLFGECEAYRSLNDKERASNCIKCGICETHCPQGIEIMKEMESIKTVFES